MSFVRSLFLDRIGGQIAILILLSLLAIHGVITVSLYVGRHGERFEPPRDSPAELAAVVKTIAAEPEAGRPAAIARAAAVFPDLHLTPAAPLPATDLAMTNDRRLGFLAHRLGPAFRLGPLPGPDDQGERIVVVFPDGDAVATTLPAMPEPPTIAGPIAMTALFVIISVTLLGLWAARSLRSPLSAFAQGACAQHFTGYVGVDYLDSSLFFTYLLPSARSWESDDDRDVICFVTTTGGTLTGSVKGSKK